MTSTAAFDAPTGRRLISAHAVSFTWRSRRASRRVLDNFNLSIARGEHVGLLGPNGSGKSTALALLAGLQRPEQGEVLWHLDGATLPPTSPRARAAFGVVFQHPSLDLQLSARENLSLAAEMRGLSRRNDRNDRIDALLAHMGLSERANDRVRDFSGGMRRRLDLARSLLANPRALLLDEPTAGLDEHGFRAFWSALETLRPAGLTTVVATHRPDEAALCDRLLLIHEGRVAREGPPAELIAELGEGVIVLTAPRPDEVARTLVDLGLDATVSPVGASEIRCAIPRGDHDARLLVRVVEAFPKGRLETIALRKPTLADVFAKVTGATLDTPSTPEAA